MRGAIYLDIDCILKSKVLWPIKKTWDIITINLKLLNLTKKVVMSCKRAHDCLLLPANFITLSCERDQAYRLHIYYVIHNHCIILFCLLFWLFLCVWGSDWLDNRHLIEAPLVYNKTRDSGARVRILIWSVLISPIPSHNGVVPLTV